MKTFLKLAAVLSLALTPGLFAQETAPGSAPAPAALAPSQEALHDEIRAIRDEILAAIGRGDFDAIVPHLHPNVVFTPMNNKVCRGPEEVRAYFNRMLKGPDAVLKSVRFDMKVDRLTDLYGDTGLAFGDSDAVYVMNNGTELPIRTRWTCALVRQGGKFKIAAFQASPDAFDNPILTGKSRLAALKGGGIGLVAGLLLGLLLGVPLARRRRA
ncbi:MAG: YybH family protein [Thermoanaerobaculia bacterium]